MSKLKCVLVVGRRFRKGPNGWLTEGARGPETGERYLEFFDELTVLGRAMKVSGACDESLTAVDPRVSIQILPNMSGLYGQIFERHNMRTLLTEKLREADAVIVRLPNQNAFEAVSIAKSLKKPLACDIGGRSMDALSSHGNWAARLYAPISEIRARRAVRRCDYVSFVTKEYLQAFYPPSEGAATVACSNVEIPKPCHQVLNDRMAKIAIRNRPIVFGTIGSLSGHLKGIRVALKAFAELDTQLPDWRYFVLGGGDRTPYLLLAEKLGIGDKIIFEGTLPSGDPVYNWLQKLDVYIHPSLREGVPRTVIEAMSFACPVVATTVAGTPELLEKSDMVPPNDIPALKLAINKSLDPAWRQDRAERNWTKAKDYAKDVLQARRYSFWTGFAEFAKYRKSGS